MGRINQPIPNLFNGVSQQSPAVRLPSQLESQENGYSSLVRGLTKRPPTAHVAKLMNAPSPAHSDFFVHTMDRGDGERYQALVEDGDLTVYDLTDGTEKTVAAPDGLAYLEATNTRDSLRAITVADYTFIVNREITVTFDSAYTEDTEVYEAIVWVRNGVYSTKYTVVVDGNTVNYTTPADSYSTETIADELATDIDALGGISCTAYGSVMKITKDDDSDFTFRVQDSWGNQALVGFKGTVDAVTELPLNCWDGTRVKVLGDENAYDDYYLEFSSEDTFGPGSWIECRGPSDNGALDASTMPHSLVREADGSFTFEELEWAEREVGDEDTSPAPSFVNKKIQDVFFYRNRLGFLADENVIFSRAQSYFNFWRESTMTLLDTDPIDVASTHTKVSYLKHALPWNKTLLMFASQTQFALLTDNLLTPTSAKRVDPITSFECSDKVKPVGAGEYVYFVVPRNDYTSIREYLVNLENESNDAADITAHVPNYVPGGVFQMSPSPSEDALFVLSEDDQNAIYVYKYYWSAKEKLQSSWSRWSFEDDATILNVDVIQSTLYFTILRDDGVYLETLRLQAKDTDGNLSFPIYLDRKTEVTGVYDSDTNITTWTLPYEIDVDDVTLVLGPDFSGREGKKVINLEQDAGSPSEVYKTGDYSAGEVYAGRLYTMTAEISRQYVRADNKSIADGRLQLQTMVITFTESGYFKATVTPKGRDTYEYVHGMRLGTSEATIGEPYIASGDFKFPVQSNAANVTIQLVNDGYFPSSFQSAEWTGQFVLKAKRN